MSRSLPYATTTVARQEALALLFVDVGEASAKDDRVILPLFQTLELLCTHGCLDVLSSEERSVSDSREELRCGYSTAEEASMNCRAGGEWVRGREHLM